MSNIKRYLEEVEGESFTEAMEALLAFYHQEQQLEKEGK
jgi:hypothetical protein